MRREAPFALGTFAGDPDPFAALVIEQDVFDLGRVLAPGITVRQLVDDWRNALPRLTEIAATAKSADRDHELAALRPLPPLLPCGQIFQAAANYRQHVLDLMDGAARRGDSSDGLTEDGRDSARAELDERARTGRPFVFLGSAHSLIGAHDDIVLPFDAKQHDWELELAAVIGAPARRVPQERALDVVAGYTICNDVTTRDALIRDDARGLGLDWLAGKNAPTFLPTGPLLVPAKHVGDPADLHLSLKLNGRTMQDASTADMIFDVAALIAHISTVTQLRPGDVVLTGSPAGNGSHYGIFLRPGDVIESEIAGLGTQRNCCVAERQPDADEATAFSSSVSASR